MKQRRINYWIAFATAATLASGMTSAARELILVDKGTSMAPILVAADAPPATTEAVSELADYIRKISGATPEVITGTPDPIPEHAVWIGAHPDLSERFPDTNLEFTHPEEILLACNGRHLVIAGRDRRAGDQQTEHGTANAIYTFIEKQLDVRWLWPGELGEDILPRETIALVPFEYRFHPPFRQRKMWPTTPEAWFRHQRVKLFSFPFGGGHAFTDWWEKYHATHPEYFALQPDGSRGYPKPHDVKMCVSNPGVWSQWVDNVEATLRADPARIMFSASPNDGPGECVCANCRAWDHPDGPPITYYGQGGATKGPSLTDRHVKSWNLAARALRERFPDRDLSVGAYAYSTYRSPPVAETLEPNIVVGYVGHFPLANDEVTRQERAAWLGWADKASAMVFRPNLFHYSGGWLGLPTLALRRTMNDFRFLAENKCVGLEVDTLPRCWATQGVQFYLMSQLAYDPLQDGEDVLRDYCRRGFGPAADRIAEYFDLMEQAHESILDGIKHSGAFAREAITIYQTVYTDEVLNRAEALMRAAEAQTSDGPERYWQRVAFIRTGYDFTRTQVRIMRAMKKVRESKGADRAAVKEATELCVAREALFNRAPPFALGRADWYHNSRRLDDYMGPPSKEFLAGEATDELTPAEFEGRD